jgi:pimeloyl-ACP methyl ester carboxylesterase
MSSSLHIHKRGLFGVLTLTAVAILVALLCSSPGIARSVNRAHKADPGKPTIVLVHGAWADASSWNRVIDRLQSDGYTVYAPPDPLRGLASDSRYLASFLKTIPGPIVLVGHSYGGAVITNAATSDPEVKALVYVDAFIPDHGQTILQLVSALPGSHLAGNVFNPVPFGPGAGEVDLYVQPSVFPDAFANGLSPRLAAELATSQRPLAQSALQERSGPPAWATIRSWSVIGTEDHVIPPAEQVAMSTHAGAQITEIDAPHLSMLADPADVTHVIVEAARTVS